MPGNSSVASANYAQVVKSIYEQAWTPPDDTASDDANVKVRVTIASDGTVISARDHRRRRAIQRGCFGAEHAGPRSIHRAISVRLRPTKNGLTSSTSTSNQTHARMKNNILHSIKICLPIFLALVALNFCRAQEEINIQQQIDMSWARPSPSPFRSKVSPAKRRRF